MDLGVGVRELACIGFRMEFDIVLRAAATCSHLSSLDRRVIFGWA